MNTSMPSPIGHALAGVAVALAGDPQQPAAGGIWRFLTRPLTLWCVALATLPDADLLLRGFHRTATHSISATLLLTILAIVVTGWVTRLQDPAQQGPAQQGPAKAGHYVLMCAAAHASHLLTDWLGADLSTPAGIQLLWPFSDQWFISGWHLFPQIERRQMFSAASIAINLKALAWEIGLLGPIVLGLWWLRVRLKPDTTY